MRNLLLATFLSLTLFSHAQTYKDPKASVEARVNDLLKQMTLEEKIDYIGGYKDFYIRGIERFGLPEIKMTDGPVGTRNYGKTTAYPASILTAATWDIDLAQQLGVALGKDARERGVHILLAPGVNIYRAPMNGRNFEYLAKILSRRKNGIGLHKRGAEPKSGRHRKTLRRQQSGMGS